MLPLSLNVCSSKPPANDTAPPCAPAHDTAGAAPPAHVNPAVHVTPPAAGEPGGQYRPAPPVQPPAQAAATYATPALPYRPSAQGVCIGDAAPAGQ